MKKFDLEKIKKDRKVGIIVSITLVLCIVGLIGIIIVSNKSSTISNSNDLFAAADIKLEKKYWAVPKVVLVLPFFKLSFS